MRLPAALFALVLATTPLLASAQTVPPAPAPSPGTGIGAEVSAGLRMASQTLQTQLQARTAILAALTPAHRELLAKIVGELAIAPDPNLDAAAARLDAALFPAEVQAIGRVEAGKRAQVMAEAGQLRSTLQSTLSAEQLKQMQAASAELVRGMAPDGRMNQAMAKMIQAEGDPGHVLLTMVLVGMQPYGKIFHIFEPNGNRR